MASNPLPQPQRRKGFTPFPNDVLLDWPRLLSGNAQIFTVMYLNSETTGAVRTRGTEPPYWSRPINNEELAGFARCSVRAIQLAVDELVERKVIERKSSFRGAFRYHIPFDVWPSLPDRPTNVVPISAESEEPEEESEEESRPTGQVVPVFSKPQRLRGGARPRPKELPGAASKLRVTSNGEIEYMGTLCDGVLSIELNIPKGEDSAKGSHKTFQNRDPKSNKTHVGVVDDRAFAQFERAARKAELSFSKSDLVAMHKQWAKLSAEERATATQGLLDRAAAGEYSNPTYRPLPQNYLAKRMWERAIRKPAGKAEAKMDERRRNWELAHKMLREDAARKAGRS
jgi:hypothetical protein